MFREDLPAAEPPPPTPRDIVRDHRVRPHGLVPRHLQTWIMAGLTVAILLIIVITGKPSPARRSPAAGTPQASTALSPDRLKRFQEQLTEQEARLRRDTAEAQAATSGVPADPRAAEPSPADPIVEEQRRRAYSSLFADNVAFTRRRDARPAPARQVPPADPLAAQADTLETLARMLPPPPSLASAPPPTASTPAASTDNTPKQAQPPVDPDAKPLLEGTVIKAVLTNRLDGSFNGPLNALVTSPVYTHDRQTILIPSGARVLGTASPVQAFGESRLAVRFHRLVMPSGTTYSLDRYPALNQRGDAGLKDRVDRRYLQLFGASLAIGTLSGLAQYSTRSGASGEHSFSDAYGQGFGASLASSAGRILDRFLNVLPTVTIREGHRIKIYLTSDLHLPPYRAGAIRQFATPVLTDFLASYEFVPGTVFHAGYGALYEKGFGSVEPVPGVVNPNDSRQPLLMINRGLFLKASYLRRF